MNRVSIVRNRVLLGTLCCALGGCFAQQSNGPDDLGRTDNDPRHSELVAVDGVTPQAVHAGPNLSISGTTPLGGQEIGPQPEPWTGANGDPNGGPQPEPWKPRRIAPDPGDTASAPAPK